MDTDRDELLFREQIRRDWKRLKRSRHHAYVVVALVLLAFAAVVYAVTKRAASMVVLKG